MCKNLKKTIPVTLREECSRQRKKIKDRCLNGFASVKGTLKRPVGGRGGGGVVALSEPIRAVTRVWI